MSRPLHPFIANTNWIRGKGRKPKPNNILSFPSEANLRFESRWLISLKMVDLQSVARESYRCNDRNINDICMQCLAQEVVASFD